MLHFAPFLSPFELYALNSILLFTLCLSNFQLFSAFFFREGVRIEPHITLCVFLSTPFELHALNPILLSTSFLSKLQFFSCFEHFSTRCQNRTPCYISGRFCPAKPKIKPYNQPLEPHTEHPKLPKHLTKQ